MTIECPLTIGFNVPEKATGTNVTVKLLQFYFYVTRYFELAVSANYGDFARNVKQKL